MGIQLKASLFLASLLLLTISILSYLVLRGIDLNYRKQSEERLYQQSKAVNLYFKQTTLQNPTTSPQDILLSESFIKQVSYMSKMRVMIFDQQGEQVADSSISNQPIILKELIDVVKRGNIAYKTVGKNLIYIAPLYGKDRQIGMIQFVYPLQPYLEAYNDTLQLFLSIGGALFFISFIVSFFYFRPLILGIAKLKTVAGEIAQGDFQHVPLKRKDELGQLSARVVEMGYTIAENIAALKCEQKKLEHALQKVKLLESQQKLFINSVTHELKTPLTVIKTYVDLLGMYQDDKQLLADAQLHLKNETERLYGMVEQVLQLASLEKYEFSLQAEVLQLDQILLDQCARMSQKAQKYDVKIEHQLQSPLYVYLDRESAVQIFTNLIDNAIKYNRRPGKVFVCAKQDEERIIVSIKDTGMGIPKQLWKQVFEPFYIVHKERSKDTGGSGLGLSLVKRWVEQQQGTIEIQESNEQGTCFQVTFPKYIPNP